MIRMIISGGQTGADRAALDWSISRNVSHGGWCPRGRVAEDGTIRAGYKLRETPSSESDQRTGWNIRDSDATVIFSLAQELSGGTRLTAALARQSGKPLLHLCRAERQLDHPTVLLRFIQSNDIAVLNVAGPRASEEPQVYQWVWKVLESAFARCGAEPTKAGKAD
ncbi:MAG: putative molybdenum carrier protein [Pyrinomonadaceae bacterium]|nr:putative molybdenum carrier protein [Pyrinomonadaceae bacterium]